MKNHLEITIPLALTLVILGWAPWLDTIKKTGSLASIGGPSCDYVIIKWRPFGRQGESCGVRWSMSFFGKVDYR